jgi:hypothetical protein
MKRMILLAGAVFLTRGLHALYANFKRRSGVREQTKELQRWEGEGGSPSDSPPVEVTAQK